MDEERKCSVDRRCKVGGEHGVDRIIQSVGTRERESKRRVDGAGMGQRGRYIKREWKAAHNGTSAGEFAETN